MLQNEVLEQDFITPTLPSLKAICERLPAATDGTLQKALHGLTSGAVETINNMRSRSASLAVRLTKANMLALTVVVTALPPSVNLSRAVLEEFTYLLSHKIATDDGEVSVTASTCARSLLLASGRNSAAVRYCAGQVIAGLVASVAQRAEQLSGTVGKNHAKLIIIAEEVKALVGLFGTLPASTCEYSACTMSLIRVQLIILTRRSCAHVHHRANIALAVSGRERQHTCVPICRLSTRQLGHYASSSLQSRSSGARF